MSNSFFLQIRFNIYSALILKTTYISAWFDLSMERHGCCNELTVQTVFDLEKLHLFAELFIEDHF